MRSAGSVAAWISVTMLMAIVATLGHAQAQGLTIDVPLQVEGSYLGDIGVTVGIETPTLDADRFFSLLGDRLRSDIRSELSDRAENGVLATTDLQAVGLEAIFDQREMALKVAVPLELRATETLSLGRQRDLQPEDYLLPDGLSGFANLRAGQSFVHSAGETGTTGRQPLSAGIDGGLNLFGAEGVSVLGTAFFQEAAERPWRRGTTTAFHDDRDTAIRYAAGDLNSPTVGFQSAPALGGFSITRRYDEIQPDRVVTPSGQTSFTLERPAVVDVVVNGVTIRTLQLPAGRFDIRDFPFFNGVNDIVLEIENDLGETRIVRFSQFFDAELLAPGIREFGVSIGAPRQLDVGDFAYDESDPFVTTFYRQALSSSVTAGANIQANGMRRLYGAEGVWATPFGNVAADLGVSESGSDDQIGYAAATDYQIAFGNERRRRLNLSLDYTSQHFGSPTDVRPDNQTAWALAAQYSQPLWDNMSASVGASYARRRGGAPDRNAQTVGLAWRVGKMPVFLNMDRVDDGDETNYSALLSVSFRFGDYGSVSARHDTATNESSLEWNIPRAPGLDAVGGRIGVSRSPEDTNVRASVDYVGNRAFLSGDHRTVMPQEGPHQRSTSVQGAVGIGFADGDVAVGRPVTEGFAIVSKHESLRDADVSIGRNIETARTDFLGPALVSGIDAHRGSGFDYKVDGAPVGYDTGPGQHNVLVPPAGGVAVEVGSAASLTVLGKVTDRAGQAVALVGGEVRPLAADAAVAKTVKVFTNRGGRFVAQRLSPGSYEVRLFTKPELVAQFEVPDSAVGFHGVGTLTVLKEQVANAG